QIRVVKGMGFEDGSVSSTQMQRRPEERTRLGESVLGRIGNTPLLRLERIGRELASTKLAHGENVEVCAKAEWFNPGGSVKDRPALNMIEAGLASGALRAGKTIIDATS